MGTVVCVFIGRYSNAVLAAVKKNSDYEANDLRLRVSPKHAMLR